MEKPGDYQLINFKLGNKEYIELFKLIKALNLAGSGGEAKHLIDSGLVKLNGKLEQRRGAKVRRDDTVELQGHRIIIVS